jgi:hypothetical protein
VLGLGAAAVLAACDREAPAAPPLDDADPTGAVAEGAISVASTGGTLRLSVGESQTLQATRLQRRSRYIRWTSSNPTVASVSTTGVVRGVTPGEARITASSTVGTEQTRVQVASPAAAPVVAAVTVSSPSTSLVVGGQMAMTAVATDASGAVITGRPVAWSVTSGPAATISSTGVVTALAAGTATVQATVDGVSGTRVLTVTTPPPDPAPTLASLAISPKTVSLATGGTRQFAVSGVLSNGQATVPAVTYSATGGTVTSAGLYTAPSTAGTYRVIAAQSGGTLRDTAVVTVTAPAPTVTAFTIAPKTGSSLAPGGTRQFSTSVTWSDGATRSVGVTYSATGGSISTSGLFTAGQLAGTFLVIANCACGRADTAQVVISAPTAQLTSLVISPKAVTLQAGATQQFAAAATWSTGATTLPPVTWSAIGGGNVSASGLYTAPTAAGTYRVVVAHSGGTRRDTAIVTVLSSGSGTTPPPPSGSATCPNEPAGFALVGDTRFATLNPSGWTQFYGQLVSDATAPELSTSIAFRFPKGAAEGGYGAVEPPALPPETRRVYSCFFWKQSANFRNHPSDTKVLYPFRSTGSGSTRDFVWGFEPVGSVSSGQFRSKLTTQSSVDGDNYRDNLASMTFSTGRWYRTEILVIHNSPGVKNGTYTAWSSEWNGTAWTSPVRHAHWTTVGYSDSGQPGIWTRWQFDQYMGGQGGTPVPEDQFIYFNRVRVTGSR